MVMSAEAVAPWQVVGRSVRGASHLRDGFPNQDTVALNDRGGGQPALAIAAVADGHGGRRRSAVPTAPMAVEVALQVLCSMAALRAVVAADRSELAAARGAMAIVSAWTDAVRRHGNVPSPMKNGWRSMPRKAPKDRQPCGPIRSSPMVQRCSPR
jgi:hypothetical protein